MLASTDTSVASAFVFQVSMPTSETDFYHVRMRKKACSSLNDHFCEPQGLAFL